MPGSLLRNLPILSLAGHQCSNERLQLRFALGAPDLAYEHPLISIPCDQLAFRPDRIEDYSIAVLLFANDNAALEGDKGPLPGLEDGVI